MVNKDFQKGGEEEDGGRGRRTPSKTTHCFSHC